MGVSYLTCAMNGAASGQQIIEAIVNEVRRRLQEDCYLAPHMVHDDFSFSAAIEVGINTGGQRVLIGTTIHGGNGRLDSPVSLARRPHQRCLAKPRTGQNQAEEARHSTMGWPTPFFVGYAVQKVA